MVRSKKRFIRRQRYIETVMRDTSNASMQSCTKSCYSIKYSICVQWPKAVDMRYKIMKQLTVQARTKRTSQMRNWCNGHVSSTEGTRRRWWVSASAQTRQERKDFSFVIHCDSFPLRWIVVKDKTNSRFRRSLIAAYTKEHFVRDFSRN